MNNIDILKQLKNLENLELVANNVIMEDGKTVEDVILANKINIQSANSNISALQSELGINKSTLEANINSIREVL